MAMAFRTEQDLKETYARLLREQKQAVSVDVPVAECKTTIDILTSREIIVCKLVLDHKSAIEARSQLEFYGSYSHEWQKVVVVQSVESQRAAEALRSSGIQVVIVESAAAPALASQGAEPTFTYSSAYDYRAFEGGKGGTTALCAIALVFIVGLLGFVTSRHQQPSGDSFKQLVAPFWQA